MNQTRERVLQEAALSVKAAVDYHTIGAALACAVTVIGIPLLVAAVPFARWYYGRYYATLRVVLTSRDLKIHRGVWVSEEKTIPLEQITDLRVYQGPIMRRMGLKGLAVETAGQSTQQGALATVIGIEDTDGFRDLALNQRDRIADQTEEPALARPVAAEGGSVLETLVEIRDVLKRIEERLNRDA